MPTTDEPTDRLTIHDLPFIQGGKWAPKRSGHYATDCQTGRAYAEDLLILMKRTGNPMFFSTVARAITEGGVFEGVEIGFNGRMGIQLLPAGRAAASAVADYQAKHPSLVAAD